MDCHMICTRVCLGTQNGPSRKSHFMYFVFLLKPIQFREQLSIETSVCNLSEEPDPDFWSNPRRLESWNTVQQTGVSCAYIYVKRIFIYGKARKSSYSHIFLWAFFPFFYFLPSFTFSCFFFSCSFCLSSNLHDVLFFFPPSFHLCIFLIIITKSVRWHFSWQAESACLEAPTVVSGIQKYWLSEVLEQ